MGWADELKAIGTHYVVDDRGEDWFRLFLVDTCENCGTQVEQPNSVRVHITEKTLKDAGLTRLEARLPEQFWSDELGHCACDDCGGEEQV